MCKYLTLVLQANVLLHLLWISDMISGRLSPFQSHNTELPSSSCVCLYFSLVYCNGFWTDQPLSVDLFSVSRTFTISPTLPPHLLPLLPIHLVIHPLELPLLPWTPPCLWTPLFFIFRLKGNVSLKTLVISLWTSGSVQMMRASASGSHYLLVLVSK